MNFRSLVKQAAAYFVLLFLLGLPVSARAADGNAKETLTPCMAKARAITAGMLRKDIEEKFVQDGGLASDSGQTFFVKECRQPDGQVVKVDVTFAASAVVPTAVPSGGAGSKEEEVKGSPFNPNDAVVKVSEPYLALPVAD